MNVASISVIRVLRATSSINGLTCYVHVGFSGGVRTVGVDTEKVQRFQCRHGEADLHGWGIGKHLQAIIIDMEVSDNMWMDDQLPTEEE